MTDRFNGLKVCCGLLLASSLLSANWVYAAGPTYSAGLGLEFASGKYGTDTRTESVYVPFTATFCPTERLGFSLEIPYVYQSSSAVNTGLFGAGTTMQMQKAVSSMTGSTMGSGSISSATAANSGRSQSGPGDITAKGGYVLVPEGDLMPRVRPYVSVKFPTADKSKALGTGAFDEGFAVEFFKRMGDWYSFAEAGYTFQGKSTGLALRNYLSFNAGAGHAIGEKFLPMLIIKGSSALLEGSSNLLEARLKLKYLATAHTGIEGYLAKGITRNSPDYGSGLSVFYDF